jgi:hypothetical protein
MTTDEANALPLGQHVQLTDGRVCSVEEQDTAGAQIKFRFLNDTFGYIRWMQLPTAITVDNATPLSEQYFAPWTPTNPLP